MKTKLIATAALCATVMAGCKIAVSENKPEPNSVQTNSKYQTKCTYKPPLRFFLRTKEGDIKPLAKTKKPMWKPKAKSSCGD